MLAKFLRRFGLGKMAHNAVIGSAWQAVRIGGQALWLVAIARILGPPGYGTFAGIAGFAATLGGLVGLGTSYLLLQNVSRNLDTFGAHWTKAISTTFVSGIALGLLFTGITSLIMKDAATSQMIAAIVTSEALCYPMVYASSFAFQAHERMGWSGMLTSMMSSMRLLAVTVFWFFAPAHDLGTYVWFHLTASMLSMFVSLVLVHIVLRPPLAAFSLSKNELREGISFSAVWFTGNAVTELDKTLALRLAGSQIAGIYSAAYRAVSIATLPVASLALAAQPRLFRQSTSHENSGTDLVRNLALFACAYGIAASIGLFFLAGFIPSLLGQAFTPAVRVVHQLILIPPLFSLRLIGNAILMTSSRQLARITVEVPAVLLLVALSLVLIPRYGLSGIAITVTATELLLTVAIWMFVLHDRQQKSRRIFL